MGNIWPGLPNEEQQPMFNTLERLGLYKENSLAALLKALEVGMQHNVGALQTESWAGLDEALNSTLLSFDLDTKTSGEDDK